MTFEEFQKELNKLFKKFQEDDNDSDFIFALSTKVEKGRDIRMCGYGCSACVVEELIALLIEGEIKHNAKEKYHVGKKDSIH